MAVLQRFKEKAHDFSRGMNPTNPVNTALLSLNGVGC